MDGTNDIERRQVQAMGEAVPLLIYRDILT